ncbi:GNAT family N-acetyltransferase [Jannaschia sp. W003]|uniref:GNAT family N-acetyltransferase n=1 Tax=Jannaschia sp. W003 TaxID=2867012 RepID=UPI0021A60398|nr:GNAT family protein [Jannaschia sp. W003]UWQ22649.1 GNAT family N-acetyltransferase [Jannaschia sp. W003]
MDDALDWTPPLDWSPPAALHGAHVRLERLAPRHAPALRRAMLDDDSIWRWLPYGPFASDEAHAAHLAAQADAEDPAFYAIGAGDWRGVGALMRIDRPNGAIEIGHLCFAPALQRTIAATEALFLLADHAFASGFRRLEWKCDARNAASRRAALRLGFAHEGTFRQAAVVKGRNRDTAWFAILDGEWPALHAAVAGWLEPGNFVPDGTQRSALGERTAEAVRGLGRPDAGG